MKKLLLLALAFCGFCVAQTPTYINGAVVPANLACVGTNAASQLVLGAGCGGSGGGISGPGSTTVGFVPVWNSTIGASVANGLQPTGTGPKLASSTGNPVSGNCGQWLSGNIVDSGSPCGTGTGAVWGSITGTLSSQTDLQTALNAKAPVASPTFTGVLTSPSIVDSALTNGQCVQAGSGGVLTTTGSSCSSGGGTPGGSTGQIQFNNAGSFGGISATGTGNVVLANSPTLVTPNLGVPSALNLTNATGYPIATTSANGVARPDGITMGITGGGVMSVLGGASVTFPANNSIVVSNTTSAPAGLAPVNGDCVVGSGGVWTAGSCTGSSGTNFWSSGSGVPTANCTVGNNYYLDTAFTNPGTAIYFCSATNTWSALFSIDLTTGMSYHTSPNGIPQIGLNTSAVCLLTNACTTNAVQTFSAGIKTSGITGVGSTPTATVTGSGCAFGTIVGTDLAGIIPMTGTTGTASCTITVIPAVAASAHYFCSALQKRGGSTIATQTSDSATSAVFSAISVTSSDTLQYGACIKQ